MKDGKIWLKKIWMESNLRNKKICRENRAQICLCDKPIRMFINVLKNYQYECSPLSQSKFFLTC